MATEIERKFLTAGDFHPFVVRSKRIVQGYFCVSERLTARVRIHGDEACLGIKGGAVVNGWSRLEFEYKIPVADAEEILNLCGGNVIDKVRHYIPAGKHTWEVDVFHGKNEGLVLAEIELEAESEAFEHPAWLGEEVSSDARYYNSRLSEHPYCEWK